MLCIGKNNAVIERFGIEDDVDVKPGETTEAVITGWLTPYTPYMNDITPNPSSDGAFTVTWNRPPAATTFVLQEADNSQFTGARTVYTGTEASRQVSGKVSGTYYYRVSASNEYSVISGWSDPASVKVAYSYTISGTITGADGMTVTMIGDKYETQTVNDGERYTFSVEHGGSYTVTPTKTGYNFTPASKSFSNVTSNQSQDFTGAKVPYTISGTITGADGMTVTMIGDKSETQTVNDGERYTFSVEHGGSYTVTPSKTGYTFTPTSKSFSNVTSNQTQDFTGKKVPYTISGTITGADGVTVTLIGDKSETRTVNDGGKYTFSVEYGGSYTVTPTKTGYNFTPQSKSFSNVTSNQSQDFTGAKVPYTISGTITGADGMTVTMIGDKSETQTVNDGDRYTFSVEHGGSYTVTPSKTGYTFTPTSKSFSNVTSNQTQDFTEAKIPYTLSGTITGADVVTVTMIGDKSETQTVNNGEMYSFTVEHGGSYTVTPTKTGYNYTLQSKSFSNVTSNQTQDFTGAKITYTISGTITGADGVTVTMIGDTSDTRTVNSGGKYTFSVEHGGSYTVTPAKAGYRFTPESMPFSTVTSNQTQDFTASEVQEKQYTLTMDVNNSGWGTTNPSAGPHIYIEGSVVAITTAPAEGYRFVSWTGGAADSTAASTTVTMTGDRTVTAYFEKRTFFISGIVSGADSVAVTLSGDRSETITVNNGAAYSFTVEYGGDYTLTLSKTYYTFTPPGKTFSNVTSNQTQSFTAVRNTHAISGKISGASGVTVQLIGDSSGSMVVNTDGGSYSFTVREGGDYTVTPSKTGYRFTPSMWLFSDVVSDKTQDFSGDKIKYTISGVVRGANGITVTLSGGAEDSMALNDGGKYSFTVEHGGTYTVRPSKSGYKFTPESKTFNAVSSDQAQDFTASEIKRYTLTMAVNTAGWGATTPSVGSASYNEGTVVTITATPASGYRFVNWTGGVASTSSATTTVTMSADRTVTANFEKIPTTQYTLTMAVNTTGLGTTSPSVGAHTYDSGTSVTITATPATGYWFVTWTGSVADTSKQTTTVTVSGNMTVTANFEKIPTTQYTLTMAVNTTGWGTTSPSVGAHTYDSGMSVTITATPASGYRFVNWTGSVADTGKQTTTVTMIGDQTVTANFTKITPQEITVVSIPNGTFQMGRAGVAEPVHSVTLSAFEMSVYEITQGQYKSVIGTNPSNFKDDDNLPVEQVSWWDAIKFCNALSANEGLEKCYNEYTGACDFSKKGFRLPTEAEWEYACRAGTTTAYYTGDIESDLARAGWYGDNSSNKTHPVGQKTSNAWGLYDMHGNVWEWCNDWRGSYPSGGVTNPTGAQTGYTRAVRGGSWSYAGYGCGSAIRGGDNPVARRSDIGFRVVRCVASQYILTMAVNTTGWGITDPKVGTHSYYEGTTVTVIATSTPYYRFVGWTGNVADTGKQSTTVTVTGNMTVTANFEKVTEPTSITMVSIPGGSFSMGSNSGESDNRPVHTVTVSGFEMGMYEITQGQYLAIIGANPSTFAGDDNLPVEEVTWHDAVRFCNKQSDTEGLERCYNESTWECDFSKKGYRLPTEAEWEYACRAGTSTNYYTGDSENDLARAGWYSGNSNKTHPVGQKTPNAWGLYDMHGNVWEWCNDWYGSYSGESATNPTGAQTGSYCVFRGGCWLDYAHFCQSAIRCTYSHLGPGDWIYYTGFRVVRRP